MINVTACLWPGYTGPVSLHRSMSPTKDEALRDLVRARADAQNAHKRAKQQLKAFLLRHHKVFLGKNSWLKTYFNWLADLTMKHLPSILPCRNTGIH